MDRQMMIMDMERYLVCEGYKVSGGSGCFDLLARRDSSIALKVLANVDSFTQSEALDLQTISHFLDTQPFLIGERANRYDLEDSVVYERFGVAAMSPSTFTKFVRGVMPGVRTRRGGFTVRVDAEGLEKGMLELGISMAELSARTGLSKKTLYKCGRGGQVDLRTYKEIRRVMGVSADSLRMDRAYDSPERDPGSGFKRRLSGELARLGFRFSFLSRSPFNLVLKQQEAVISLASPDRKRLAAGAGILQGLERDFDLSPVCITGTGNLNSVSGVPVISLSELAGMDCGSEFMQQVADRQS